MKDAGGESCLRTGIPPPTLSCDWPGGKSDGSEGVLDIAAKMCRLADAQRYDGVDNVSACRPDTSAYAGCHAWDRQEMPPPIATDEAKRIAERHGKGDSSDYC
jgi:hypothetical protein